MPWRLLDVRVFSVISGPNGRIQPIGSRFAGESLLDGQVWKHYRSAFERRALQSRAPSPPMEMSMVPSGEKAILWTFVR